MSKGQDNFKFHAPRNTAILMISTACLVVIVSYYSINYKFNQYFYIITSLIISVFLVIGVYLIINIAINKYSRKQKTNKIEFRDIYYNSVWKPSLALFQFFLWTLIVLASYLWFFFIRLFSAMNHLSTMSQAGAQSIGEICLIIAIPPSILLLMGISAAVPVASTGINDYKDGDYITVPPKRPEKLDPLIPNTLFVQGTDQISLSRFQMFAWTILSVIIYIGCLIFEIQSCNNLITLSLPDIDVSLVTLMGISQGSFLGMKAISPSFRPKVSSVIPSTILKSEFEIEKKITIRLLGGNFLENQEGEDLKMGLRGKRKWPQGKDICKENFEKEETHISEDLIPSKYINCLIQELNKNINEEKNPKFFEVYFNQELIDYFRCVTTERIEFDITYNRKRETTKGVNPVTLRRFNEIVVVKNDVPSDPVTIEIPDFNS